MNSASTGKLVIIIKPVISLDVLKIKNFNISPLISHFSFLIHDTYLHISTLSLFTILFSNPSLDLVSLNLWTKPNVPSAEPFSTVWWCARADAAIQDFSIFQKQILREVDIEVSTSTQSVFNIYRVTRNWWDFHENLLTFNYPVLKVKLLLSH